MHAPVLPGNTCCGYGEVPLYLMRISTEQQNTFSELCAIPDLLVGTCSLRMATSLYTLD